MEYMIIVSLLVIVLIIAIISIILIYKYNIKLLDLEEKELKNKKYELFNSIDIEETKKIVDSLINEYVDKYVLYKFVANNIPYIREPDQNEMIKNITRNIMLDISELYIYYISLITSINTDEDLTRFIHTKVKNNVISFVANYNKARTETPKTKMII